MNDKTKAAILKIANNNNGNYKTFDKIPKEKVDRIQRTHNFDSLSGNQSVLGQMSGSVADRLHEWKQAESAAQRSVDQTLERENPKRQKTAKEIRVDYLQSKRVDPLKGKYHQRQLKEAIQELKEEQRELSEQAKIAETKQAIAQNDTYRNAIENAESHVALAESTEDKTEALIQLKLLQSVSDASQIEKRVNNYSQAEAQRSERQVLNEMETASQTAQAAANAVKADSNQQTRILKAQQLAEVARGNAETSH